MIRVFRIQDSSGRGPFRPGLSRFWKDETFAPGLQPLPTWMEEFGADLIERAGHAHEHFGSAVRTVAGLAKWFSPTECVRLAGLGFNIVMLPVQRILAESENQLVFARRHPLNKGGIIVPWEGALLRSDGDTV